MSANKHIRRKTARSEGDHDILGIVLIIISAFLLLCSIIPIIFGVVSEVLRNVLLGLFGLSAYAWLALVLAVGIGMVMHRRLNVSGARIALVVGMAVLLICILQLATTANMFDLAYGDYLASVYSSGLTAGGLIFGIFAYAIKCAIQPVATFIVLSLGLLACAAALGYSLYKQYRSDDKGENFVKDAPPPAPAPKTPARSFTDAAPPRRVHVHNPATKLFVEDIIPRNPPTNVKQHAAEELFSDGSGVMRDEYGMDKNYAERLLYTENSQPVEPSEDKITRPKSAQEELYGMDYYSQGGEDAPRYTEIRRAAETEIRQRPDKVVHENKNKMPGIVIPTQKATDGYENPGVIINTDAAVRGGIISQSMLDEAESEQPSEKKEGGFYSGVSDSGIVKGEAAPRPAYGFRPMSGMDIVGQDTVREEKKEEPAAPIINAESFASEPEEPKEEKKPEPERKEGSRSFEMPFREEDKHVGLYDSFSAFGGSFIGFGKQTEPTPPASKPEPLPEPDTPIVNDSLLADAEAKGEIKEQEERKSFYDDIDLSNDREQTAASEAALSSNVTDAKNDRKADEIKKDAKEKTERSSFDISSMADEPDTGRDVQPAAADTRADESKKESVSEPVATERGNQAFRSDQFIIDDTVVDLSEKHEDFGHDSTGYYESVPAKPAKKAAEPQPEPETLTDIPLPPEPYDYSYPPVSLLSMPEQREEVDTGEIENKSHDIEEVLASLKFPAKVVNVITGPRVTRYELQPQGGIPVRRILSLDKDLEFTLASGAIRIEAPVANKQAIGIEVANNSAANVSLREIIESPVFSDKKYVLPLAIGKDIGGDAVIKNLEKMPHLLIAGATGTGKSVCLNTLILSLIFRCSPEDVRIVLVDPKRVEFTLYRELPHLLLRNPITDVDYAVNALEWLIDEMNRRYDVFSRLASNGAPVRNLAEYNASSAVREGKAMKLPYIVMIVDELADLMSSRKKDVENRIRIITQKSRASGIHLILATQRPSVDVITGTIKINLPSRIAFKVMSNADSRTILDQGGAETLLGSGDMLLMANSEPIRLQGAYVSNEEIVGVVDYVKKHNKAIFDENIEKAILAKKEAATEAGPAEGGEEESADEKLFPDIMRCLITNGTASTSLIQRRFSLGYSRASRIIDTFEQRKWVGPSAGAKPREVYMTETQFEAVFGRPFNE